MIIKSTSSSLMNSPNSHPEQSFVRSDKAMEKRLTQARINQAAVEQEKQETQNTAPLQDTGSVGFEKRLAISVDNEHYKLQISRDGLALQQAEQASASDAAQQEAASEWKVQGAKQMAAGASLTPAEMRQKGVTRVQ
ncbi:hypothetical protein [Azotosporobacter soli]|uniref:hypothetical protein n=1 Tax=Azotosporobacter soli TaxID=3055040 RepID=UPI0031FEC664